MVLVYQELFFEKATWVEMIDLAASVCDVWIDVFDTYSVEILGDVLGVVKGVKLQASVLDNQEVFIISESLDLGDIEALINVSGYSLNEISSYIEAFSEVFPKSLFKLVFKVTQ